MPESDWIPIDVLFPPDGQEVELRAGETTWKQVVTLGGEGGLVAEWKDEKTGQRLKATHWRPPQDA